GMYISGGGLALAQANNVITINGDLNLSGGSIAISGTSDSLKISGNWNQTGGTFTQTTGNVFFNGSSPQSISGGPGFSAVDITNPAGVTLNSTVTIPGPLSLTAGIVSTGANTLSIASTGSVTRTSGYVSGNLAKNAATGATTLTYEVGSASAYAPV